MPTEKDEPASPIANAAIKIAGHDTTDGISAQTAALTIRSDEKTVRPPNLSVNIPIGKRASDPSKTGTATRVATCVLDRDSSCLKVCARPLSSPQAIKQRAKENVAIARCDLGDIP